MANGEAFETGRPLLAVLLLTRPRSGPKLVFHYPPNPQRQAIRKREHGNDETGSDENEDSDDEGVFPAISQLNIANGQEIRRGERLSAADDSDRTTSPNDLLGFSEDGLEKILSPDRWSDRKKFEINVDGLVFLSHPICANQDGNWSRKESTSGKDATRDEADGSTTLQGHSSEDIDVDTRPAAGIAIINPRGSTNPTLDFTHVPESFDSRTGQSFAASANGGGSTTSNIPEPLSMFNVVFVLGPSDKTQPQHQVSDIYQHVAKKLSKALHYCQKQSGYVGLESKKLLTIKAKAKQDKMSQADLYEQSVEISELAWVLKEVYDKISVGEIAGIRLQGAEMALQAPSKDNDQGSERKLERHSALLLFDPKETLLRELSHPHASPLAYFIREHTPTKSLKKLALRLEMSIDYVLYLARHLIKWRKARAINPLHPRNTYMVRSRAPLHQINQLSHEYARKFSALPTLPQMITALSGKPMRYGAMFPSRDHRGAYMDILAYLIQHGFVEQLETFGWLQGTSTIAKKVTNELDVNQNRRPLSVASLLSPQLQPVDDDAVSVSSGRTAIPISLLEARKQKKKKQVTSAPYNTDEDTDATFAIIADPSDLSAEDTRRLEHIRDSISDEELSDRLPAILRYFDGESPFEEIAAIEGLKRSSVETWLETLMKEGFLLTYRHF